MIFVVVRVVVMQNLGLGCFLVLKICLVSQVVKNILIDDMMVMMVILVNINEKNSVICLIVIVLLVSNCYLFGLCNFYESFIWLCN